VATATVVSVKVYEEWPADWPPEPVPGTRGTVTITKGLLTESLAGAVFCNGGTEDRTICGA
jgi:hypothetical protein